MTDKGGHQRPLDAAHPGWETAGNVPIQLALLKGGSSAYRLGLVAP